MNPSKQNLHIAWYIKAMNKCYKLQTQPLFSEIHMLLTLCMLKPYLTITFHHLEEVGSHELQKKRRDHMSVQKLF